MDKQIGFTIIELVMVIVILAGLGGLFYVAWHFLSKIW